MWPVLRRRGRWDGKRAKCECFLAVAAGQNSGLLGLVHVVENAVFEKVR